MSTPDPQRLPPETTIDGRKHPYLLEDPYRVHDVAMYNFLSRIRVDYGDVDGTPRNNVPVLVVRAGVNRALASPGRVLAARGWLSAGTPEAMREKIEQYKTATLPLVSFQRGDISDDPELAGGPKELDRQLFDLATGRWVSYQWPTIQRVDYAVTLWARQLDTADEMCAFIDSALNTLGAAKNEVLIPVDHAQPWGRIFQSLRRLSGPSDRSDLEGVSVVTHRRDYSFSLRFHVYKEPSSTAAPTARVSTASTARPFALQTETPLSTPPTGWTANIATVSMHLPAAGVDDGVPAVPPYPAAADATPPGVRYLARIDALGGEALVSVGPTTAGNARAVVEVSGLFWSRDAASIDVDGAEYPEYPAGTAFDVARSAMFDYEDGSIGRWTPFTISTVVSLPCVGVSIRDGFNTGEVHASVASLRVRSLPLPTSGTPGRYDPSGTAGGSTSANTVFLFTGLPTSGSYLVVTDADGTPCVVDVSVDGTFVARDEVLGSDRRASVVRASVLPGSVLSVRVRRSGSPSTPPPAPLVIRDPEA